jgi:hypothetical protein
MAKKTKIPNKEKVTITVEMELLLHPDNSEGRMTLRHADCSRYVTNPKTKEEVGGVEGVIGGGVQISFSREEVYYIINPRDLWNAACKALKMDDHVIQ